MLSSIATETLHTDSWHILEGTCSMVGLKLVAPRVYADRILTHVQESPPNLAYDSLFLHTVYIS